MDGEKDAESGAPLLTGNIQEFTSNPMESVQTEIGPKMQFVVGPDGQRYAVAKTPWDWKGFVIGFSVPTMIMVVAIIGFVTGDDSYEYWDRDPTIRDSYDDLQLVNGSEGNDSAYSGVLEMVDGGVLLDCTVWVKTGDVTKKSYGCEKIESDGEWPSDFDIVYWENDGDQGIVGSYGAENQTFWFDDGEIWDEIEVSITWIPELNEYEEWVEEGENRGDVSELFIGLCCFSPVLGIVGAIVAFLSGKKDMGIGFLVAVVTWPLMAIGLLIAGIGMTTY